MKILNPKLLKKYRTPGPCEMCQRPCQRRQPHHIISRGFGGSKRLDVEINLVALGSAFECSCHTRFHSTGELQPEDFMQIVARREGVMVWDVQDVLYFLRRLPQNPFCWQVEAAIEELEPEARELAAEVLGRVLKFNHKGD